MDSRRLRRNRKLLFVVPPVMYADRNAPSSPKKCSSITETRPLPPRPLFAPDPARLPPTVQRSWVWDEDRIKSLIASVSRAFPVGALISLETGGPVNFKPRPVEGTPAEAKTVPPNSSSYTSSRRSSRPTAVAAFRKVLSVTAS